MTETGKSGVGVLQLLIGTATGLVALVMAYLVLNHWQQGPVVAAEFSAEAKVAGTGTGNTATPVHSPPIFREPLATPVPVGNEPPLPSNLSGGRASFGTVRSDWVRKLPTAWELMQDELFNPEGIQLSADGMEELARHISDYNIGIADILRRRQNVITDWAQMRIDSGMFQQMKSGEVSPPRVLGAVWTMHEEPAVREQQLSLHGLDHSLCLCRRRL